MVSSRQKTPGPQRALLEAELDKARGHLESFRAVAATTADLHLPAAAPPPPPPEEDLGPYPTVAKMAARVVADRPEGERFGPKLVVQEVNRRFGKLLRRIHQYRKGKANHEALYFKGPPPARKREEIP